MANNVFQAKRTNVSGRTPNTTGSYATNSQYIAAGEFALNMADGILYSSNGSALIEVGANNTTQRITNLLSLDNNKQLRFRTVNTASGVYFIQQNDDNFVFYTTNTSYGARPVWSIFANSDTSAIGFGVPVNFNGANVNIGTSTLFANGTSGVAGQVLTSNGSATYWTAVSGSGSTNVNAQYVWSNLHTFQANVAFTGNGIGITSNTGAIYLGGLADANWKIGRNTGVTTKWRYTNNSIDIITANSNLEGFSIGLVSGNSYFETGYLGTYIASNVTIGNASSNSTINSTAFSGSANNATNFGGQLPAYYTNATNITTGTLPWGQAPTGTVNTSGNFTLSGNTTLAGTNTTISSNVNVTGTFLNVASAFVVNSVGAYHTGTVNAASHTVGTTFIANTSQLTITVPFSANGSTGTAGFVLTSNGASGAPYWAAAGSGSVNVAAQYTWTNTQTFTNTITFSGGVSMNYANVTGQVNTATLYTSTSANLAGQYSNTLGFYPTSNSVGSALGNGTSRWTIVANDVTTGTFGVGARFYTTATSSSFEANTYITGNIILGGPSQTGYIWLGQSTANQTVSIANGATTSGNVKTLSIAEFGASGSQTNITVGSSSSNTLITVNANNSLFSGLINAAAYTVGSSFVANTTQVTISNIPLSANGSTGTAGYVLTSNGATGAPYWAVASAGVNTAAQYAWTNTHTFSGITTLNATGIFTTGTVNSSSYTVGTTFTANSILVNAAAINITGQVNTATFYSSTSANVGANVQLTTSSLFVGNSTVNTVQNSSFMQVSNSSATSNLTAIGLNVGANVVANTTSLKVGNTTITTTNAIFGGTIAANGGIGSAGQALLSGGGSNVYWGTVTGSGGSSNIQVQNTSVSTPNNGVLYWNSDLGKLLVYYTDGTSNQFVEATVSGSPGPAGADGAPGTPGTTIAVNTSVVIGSPGSNPSISVTSNSSYDNVITFTLSTGATGANGADGAPGAAGPTGPKAITITSPAAGDTYTIMWSNAAINLAEIKTLVQGTSPSVNASFFWGASRASGTTIQANILTSNVTNGNSQTSFTNNTPTANSFLWMTINQVTGTVTEYHATLRF